MADIKGMNYFVEVARLGSFSAAARHLRITQPAVSRRVRLLEETVGVPLLERQGRSVVPTPAGEIMLSRTTELQRSAGAIYEEVRAGAAVPSGSLALGVSIVIGHLIMAPLIKGFLRRFPAVRLHLFEGYSSFVEEWLAHGRIDVGLIWGEPRSSDLSLEPLFELELALIGPEKPLHGCENGHKPVKLIRLRDLVDFPLILPAVPHGLRLLAEQGARIANRPLNIAMECDGIVLARELVKQGMGYTLLALAGNRHEIANERLREIRISPPVYWTLSMATRKNSKRSIAVTELSREIKSTVRHMVERGELRGRILRKQGAASFRPRSGPR
ncbi:MAG TPA: LysR family transcriptional regulator [Pseudolabrys sp.]|jgi:LysR family nitrogen assimilation transcriptional regulator|nr:LysR family transcriptional regulator [Pseudolabrys sp.]